MIVCTSVKVRGHHGDRYGPEWVNRLHAAMDRNLTGPRRHVCLTDNPAGLDAHIKPIDIREWWGKYAGYAGLYNPVGGWWAKVKMFDPAVIGTHDETVLYVDLDALITGPLNGFASFPHYLRICADTAANKSPKPGVVRAFNSSVMSWRCGEFASVYNEFGYDVLDAFRSDQDWIAQRVDRGRIVTYDEHTVQRLSACAETGPHPHTRVVLCIKQKNDTASKLYPWVAELWQ